MVTAMLSRSVRQTVNIPNNMGVDGRFRFTMQRYEGRFVVQQGQGRVKVDGSFDAQRMAYQAKVLAYRFPIQHFVPRMNRHKVSSYTYNGEGTNTEFPLR